MIKIFKYNFIWQLYAIVRYISLLNKVICKVGGKCRIVRYGRIVVNGQGRVRCKRGILN